MSLVRIGRIVALAGAIGSIVVSGAVIARRSYLKWGATETEAREALPGDAAVNEPMTMLTNAVTIDAAPEDVWPWIVQLGTGRGGWYSYDFIENAGGLNVKSVDRIVPELQMLHEGDEIPLSPEVKFPVKRIEPKRLLLLEGHNEAQGDATWLFLLRETDDGATRLVVRFRVRWPLAGAVRVAMGALEPGIFAMQRKMMLGIKERAEKLARERMPVIEPAKPVLEAAKPILEPEAVF